MSETIELLEADDSDALRLLTEGTAPATDEAAAARHARIAMAAYLLAVARGFEPGRQLDDWLQAELAVDQDSLVTEN